MSTLGQGEREGPLRIERITSDRFDRAKAPRLRLRDKPLLSFTDLTTMVLMQELHLTRIVTADEHFRRVGLGFELLP